jgi:Zn-dependent protease with chaperone function
MDFFQAQDNALRKTKRLVFYFAVAVAMIIAAVYCAFTAGVIVYHELSAREGAAPSWQQPALFWDTGRFLATVAGVVLIVGLGSLYKVLALRGGGASVAVSLGGRRIDRDTREPKRRQLLNLVEEMAIASGVPVPEVYLLDDEPSINAFAAGWGTDDAVIAVSAGALEHLSRDELQGVIAHEYSHVLYGDCRLNIRLMGILYGIMMLTIFAQLMRLLLGGGRSGGRRGPVIVTGGGRRGGGGKGGGGALIIAVVLVIILVTIIGYIGTFFARLIQAAISRQREFLADAAAVQFTRNPDGIAGALKKVAAHAEHAVIRNPHAGEAAHMFFADGLKRPFASAMATHPPLKARIRQIQPGWDGKLTPTQAAAAEPPAAPERAPAAAPRPSGREMIGGMAVLGAIGAISNEHLATARRITAAIPDSLDQRMRAPEGARHAIIALLVADNPDDDARQWPLIQAACGEEQTPRIRETASAIRALPRESRLGALELASTTLAQGGAGQREAFDRLLDQLIQADDKLSLYEFCVRRILRERLARGGGSPAGTAKVNYLELKPEVARAVSVLLSVVAREAAASPDPEATLDKALAGLYLLRGKVGCLPPGEAAVADLDEPLGLLRHSAYAIRAQCLRAVVFCLKADGQLAPQEAEALRMISLALNCPAPPLEG